MSNVSLVNGHIDRTEIKDENVIKALELLVDRARVYRCENVSISKKTLEKTFDLINRQKAEIERLNKRIAGQKHSLFEQQSYTAKLQNELRTIKSEVVKEFAERLKENFEKNKYILPGINISIDNLVKEMTENTEPTKTEPKSQKGKWLINPDGYFPYCSECKAEPEGRKMTKFCPECGADMRGEKNEQI